MVKSEAFADGFRFRGLPAKRQLPCLLSQGEYLNFDEGHGHEMMVDVIKTARYTSNRGF